MKEVYLWKVGDSVVYHTDRNAAAQIDSLTRTPDKTVTEAEFNNSEGLLRIIDNEIFLGKTETEIAVETELSMLDNEESELQKKLDEKDYKVIQATERGLTLAEINPELHQNRENQRSRINEIRARRKVLKS